MREVSVTGRRVLDSLDERAKCLYSVLSMQALTPHFDVLKVSTRYQALFSIVIGILLA